MSKPCSGAWELVEAELLNIQSSLGLSRFSPFSCCLNLKPIPILRDMTQMSGEVPGHSPLMDPVFRLDSMREIQLGDYLFLTSIAFLLSDFLSLSHQNSAGMLILGHLNCLYRKPTVLHTLTHFQGLCLQMRKFTSLTRQKGWCTPSLLFATRWIRVGQLLADGKSHVTSSSPIRSEGWKRVCPLTHSSSSGST